MKHINNVLFRKMIFPDTKLKDSIRKDFDLIDVYSKIAQTIKNNGIRLSGIKFIHISLIFKRKGYYYLRLTITSKDGRKAHQTMPFGEVKLNILERLKNWLLP